MTTDSNLKSAAPFTPSLPAEGFLRIEQIISDKKAIPPIPAIIPIGRSSWWARVASGEFPQPVKLTARCTAWKISDIRQLIERLGMAGRSSESQSEPIEKPRHDPRQRSSSPRKKNLAERGRLP